MRLIDDDIDRLNAVIDVSSSSNSAAETEPYLSSNRV